MAAFTQDQLLAFLQNPSAYGSGVQIPAQTVNTTSTAPAFPGYAGLAAQAGGVIGNELAGQLDPSVLANLQQAGAERGIAMGDPGSPNANAAYLQALGLSMEADKNLGITNLNSVAQSGGQNTTQTNSNNVLQSIYAAAPNPYAAAMANLAAQQMGLGSGAGAGGVGAGVGGVSAATPGAGAGGGGAGAGGGSGLSSGLGTSTVGGTQLPPTGSNGTVTDSNGNTWQQQPDGSWLNLTTGQTADMPDTNAAWSYQAPSGSSLTWTGDDLSDLFDDPTASGSTGGNWGMQPTSGGNMYMGDLSGYTNATYTPANTYYDPLSDTSNYAPYAGYGYDMYDDDEDEGD